MKKLLAGLLAFAVAGAAFAWGPGPRHHRNDGPRYHHRYSNGSGYHRGGYHRGPGYHRGSYYHGSRGYYGSCPRRGGPCPYRSHRRW
ncbi:MAG: hypothetical protein ACI4NO_01015 [Oxalobacter sp.]